MAKNRKWKQFKIFIEKCYGCPAGSEKGKSCWLQAYSLMKEIILEERGKKSGFAPSLEDLDDVTDFEYDIQGWLEDCLDEIDMREDYETLLNLCDDLLSLFQWPAYSGSDLKFRKSAALHSLGRNQEALQFCRSWMDEEPDNIVSSTAGVYAYVAVNRFEEAEKLVNRFIPDKAACTEDNEIMFTAASKLYKAMGNKKEEKIIEQAIEKYDEQLEKEFFSDYEDDETDEFEFW